MSDQTAVQEEPSTPKPAGALPPGGGTPQDKPEVIVAAAFGGAFVFAQILKRLTR